MCPEIDKSHLSTLGKLQAYRVWTMLRDSGEEIHITPTDDKGLVLEFIRKERDLLVAIPEDGELVYYTARCEAKQFRKSGLLDFETLLNWGKWLTEDE
jgi:hypothetical protein